MKSRKLPMEKRKSPKEVSVTFTKRRQGLFSKAAELSTFCDAQIAVLVSAPSKRKIYSFGHSSVPSVLRSFLRNSPPVPNPIPDDLISAGDGVDSTVEEALSVLDDFQKSESVEKLSFLAEELGKLMDRAKRNPNYGCGTSNSAPVAGDFVFSGDGNYDFGKSNSDLQGLSLCPITDNFAIAGNGNGPISGQGFNSESAARKFGKLVEDWGKTVDFAKRNPSFECGTSKSDLQGFFPPRNYVPVCYQFPGDLVSAGGGGGGGSDSTVTQPQALSVLGDFEKSIDCSKTNSNNNYATSNSDLQVHPDFGFDCNDTFNNVNGSDFNCNGTFNNGDGLFGMRRESSSQVTGNYSTVTTSNQLINSLGSEESINCLANKELSNYALGGYATEESTKSIMEEEKRWSFKEDENGLLVANDYKESDAVFFDYWPSSS